jgi:hypothetical protein
VQARLGAAAVEALDAGAFELPLAAASPPLLRTNVAAQLPAVRLPGPGGGGASQGVGLALGAHQQIRLP